MNVGVVIFPGSNCDQDCVDVCGRVMGWPVRRCWHGDSLDPRGLDVIVLPGGFSYGDYLRCGALAALSPAMEGVREHVKRGGTVLGICNGLQILCESGLLPGTLLVNRDLRFHCEDVWLRAERRDTRFTRACGEGPMCIPIAHKEGNYFADAETLGRLEGEGQVLFRYVTASGEVTGEACPNGALNNIAGIMNSAGTVCGMMPHPERSSEALLGATDGRSIFESLEQSLGVMEGAR